MSLLELDPETGEVPINKSDIDEWSNLFTAEAFSEAVPDAVVERVYDPGMGGFINIIRLTDEAPQRTDREIYVAAGDMALKLAS